MGGVGHVELGVRPVRDQGDALPDVEASHGATQRLDPAPALVTRLTGLARIGKPVAAFEHRKL